MNQNIVNIGLFCDNDLRSDYIDQQIKESRRKNVFFNFRDVANKYLKLETFDLLLFDLTTAAPTDVKNIVSLRSRKNLVETPFLYIFKEEQLNHFETLCNDQPAGILVDPFQPQELQALVRNMSAMAHLQHLEVNKEVINGDNKLIYQYESILQLSALDDIDSEKEFFICLQQNIRQKVELTLAAEKAVFLTYEAKKNLLVFQEYKDKSATETRRTEFIVQNSQIAGALKENSPMILKEQMLLDSFIQTMEDAVSFEINSLLFVPLTVLHKIRGALVIINKRNRRTFSENDLAISLIVMSKIIYRMERLYLCDQEGIKRTAEKQEPAVMASQRGEENFCREILDSIGFGLIIFDQAYKLLYVNSFAHQTLVLEKTTLKKLPEVLGDDAFHMIDHMLKNQNVPMLRQEMLVRHPGNRQLYLGYSIYGISQNFGLNTYALTFMEISQTKRLQAEIIRMDRMASLGVLASGIAHEIRNPLAGIKAMAQTLQEELDKDDSKNEYIDRIVRQVNRLDELLKSFFSYARPQRPNPIKCNIPDIVHEVLPLFRRKIKVSNIIVKEVYSRDLKEIFVDFHQIEQVFFNLIINAIDAMKEGGTLTIRARLPEETTPIIDRRQRIPKLFSDVYNEITISDTGIGMDHETLNNMYNPFFTTKTNGTGLGLSIVYQIILEHGGQITVDSELGKGTTFRIFLPVYIKEKPKK
jgi:signal transduction histidine kinase